MEKDYSYRKSYLRMAVGASLVGAVAAAFTSRSATWSILTGFLVFVAAIVGTVQGNQAMRRTGTSNEHDFMSAEAIGCGVGLLVGAAVSAGLVSLFAGR